MKTRRTIFKIAIGFLRTLMILPFKIPIVKKYKWQEVAVKHSISFPNGSIIDFGKDGNKIYGGAVRSGKTQSFESLMEDTWRYGRILTEEKGRK